MLSSRRGAVRDDFAWNDDEDVSIYMQAFDTPVLARLGEAVTQIASQSPTSDAVGDVSLKPCLTEELFGRLA